VWNGALNELSIKGPGGLDLAVMNGAEAAYALYDSLEDVLERLPPRETSGYDADA
jgi:hypothetical protein